MRPTAQICLVRVNFRLASRDDRRSRPSVNRVPSLRLVTLAVQNAALTLIMHYSRVSAAPSQTYSAAAAVLLVELLKGGISLVIAFARLDNYAPQYLPNGQKIASPLWSPWTLLSRFRRLGKEVFRSDCWKLAIPAILYGEGGCYIQPGE